MEYLVKPWQHQLDGIERASTRALAKAPGGFGFFLEMGVGKTSTCINTIRVIGNAWKRLPRVLIFCPPIVIQNWKAEWLKNSHVDEKNIICLFGTGKKRVKDFVKNSMRPGRPGVFITNYEALNMEELYSHFLEWQPEIVVFDESHKLKNHSAVRSRLAERLVNHKMTGKKTDFCLTGPRPLVYLLSGSPILNSPMDIFHQYKILDGGKTFGLNFFSFRARYFRDKNAGMPGRNYFPMWVPQNGALEKIAELMQDNSMRVLKKDCLDLPPLVKKIISVEMAPEQRKLYDQMLKDFVAYFTDTAGKENVSVATLAVVKGLRLMQLASGYIKTVEQEELNICAGFNPKQEALEELLEELTPNHKVIIWAVWKQNYAQIRAVCEKLKIKWVEVHGDVSGNNKFVNVDVFNNDPSCRVLLGHPGSGGIGINLTSASYSIFYSRNFSLEQDIQAEARNYRGGSEIHEKVTRIDLVSADSIEEKIITKLENKIEMSEAVLREIVVDISKDLKNA